MSKQGDCFSGWRSTFSSSLAELHSVGRENQNLPGHVVHGISVPCKGLFLSATDCLFLCRECCIAYFKWKLYFFIPLLYGKHGFHVTLAGKDPPAPWQGRQRGTARIILQMWERSRSASALCLFPGISA